MGPATTFGSCRCLCGVSARRTAGRSVCRLLMCGQYNHVFAVEMFRFLLTEDKTRNTSRYDTYGQISSSSAQSSLLNELQSNFPKNRFSVFRRNYRVRPSIVNNPLKMLGDVWITPCPLPLDQEQSQRYSGSLASELLWNHIAPNASL